MKYKSLIFLLAAMIPSIARSQANDPESCQMYLDGKKIEQVTVEVMLEWCKLVPPTVLCTDGKIYNLERFNVNFLTVKPFQNVDFGIGERGVPIRAVQAAEKGSPGDALILKDVKYIDSDGQLRDLPVISFSISE